MARPKFSAVEGGISTGTNVPDGNVEDGTGSDQRSDGTGTGAAGEFDPGSLPAGSTGTGGKERKKRGPNKGKTAQNKQLDLSTLKNSLVFMHIIAAGVMGAPELALSNDQADMYATAVADVMQHYDTSVPAKTMAWMNLAAAAGGIYYQKVVAIGSRPSAR